jgi:hypothetical protein
MSRFRRGGRPVVREAARWWWGTLYNGREIVGGFVLLERENIMVVEERAEGAFVGPKRWWQRHAGQHVEMSIAFNFEMARFFIAAPERT